MPRRTATVFSEERLIVSLPHEGSHGNGSFSSRRGAFFYLCAFNIETADFSCILMLYISAPGWYNI